MFIMNKTNEYNYVPNQVNIRIRIRIRDIRFVSYPTTSGFVSIFELEYSKKCYPDPISWVSDSEEACRGRAPKTVVRKPLGPGRVPAAMRMRGVSRAAAHAGGGRRQGHFCSNFFHKHIKKVHNDLFLTSMKLYRHWHIFSRSNDLF